MTTSTLGMAIGVRDGGTSVVQLDPHTTDTGDSILRVGRMTAPVGGWQQTEHVVLTTEEREQLIEALIAQRPPVLLDDAILDTEVDELRCPVDGCQADVYLVETGYERQWNVTVEDGIIHANYGGSEDFSEYGNSDDHVRCNNGHVSNVPVDMATVEYV